MRNIQPWCVSPIMVGTSYTSMVWTRWYSFVEMDEATAQAAADAHYGEAVELFRMKMFSILGFHLVYGHFQQLAGQKKQMN